MGQILAECLQGLIVNLSGPERRHRQEPMPSDGGEDLGRQTSALESRSDPGLVAMAADLDINLLAIPPSPISLGMHRSSHGPGGSDA